MSASEQVQPEATSGERDVDREWEPTMLPMTDLTIDRARSKLSGLHFAKESLTDGERSILYIAEGLLRLIDERDDRGYAR